MRISQEDYKQYRLNQLHKIEAMYQECRKDNVLSHGVPESKIRFYNKKVVISGNNCQVYDYDKPLRVNYGTNRKDYTKNQVIEALNDKQLNKSLNRTRNNIKNLIDCNVNQFSKFITLTYAKTELNRDKVLHDLNLFTKRFKYYYKENLRYVGVLEHQKERGKKEGNEGSYHFHLIVFNDLKIDLNLLDTKIWKYGSCNTRKVDSSDNLGRYLMKYITKEVYINDRLLNKKSLFNSQGLKRPQIEYIHGVNYTLKSIEAFEECTYKKDYDMFIINDKTGEVIENKCQLKEYKLHTIKIISKE